MATTSYLFFHPQLYIFMEVCIFRSLLGCSSLTANRRNGPFRFFRFLFLIKMDQLAKIHRSKRLGKIGKIAWSLRNKRWRDKEISPVTLTNTQTVSLALKSSVDHVSSFHSQLHFLCPSERNSLIGFFTLTTNRGNSPFHIILTNKRDLTIESHRTNWHEVSKMGKISMQVV